MGYITAYSLEVLKDGATDYDEEKIQKLREFSDGANYALNEDGSTAESCKWYDHETDMKAFSKSYPDNVFFLVGEGEESGDLWHKYFKNGKMQDCKAQINFPLYDEKKLK